MGSTPTFTIVSYNICGLNNDVRVAELRMFLAQHQPSVIIILEPKINHHNTTTRRDGSVHPHTPKEPPQFYGYACLHIKHPSKPTGIVFYIHASCTYMRRDEIHPFAQYNPDDTTTTAAFVWISSPLLAHPVVVGGVYLDSNVTSAAHVQALRANITRAALPIAAGGAGAVAVASPSPSPLPPLPVYVLGDFNARHKSWDYTVVHMPQRCNIGHIVHKHMVAIRAAAHSRRGRDPTPLTLINNMYTTSRNIPTRESAGTVIDLAFTTHPHTVGSMHVVTDAQIGSDHWPIAISIPIVPPFMRGALPPRHIDASLEHSSRGSRRRAARSPSPDMEHKYDEADEKHGPPHPLPRPPVLPRPRAPAAQEHAAQEDLIVNSSSIPHGGLGLFPTRRYRKGDLIIEYTGEILTEAQKCARYPNNDGQYVMYVKRDMYMDAVDPALSSLARYINSSAGGYNNARIAAHHTTTRSSMNIVATRDIEVGEELFFPYGAGFHMTRAPPPAKRTAAVPSSHWTQHMTAPAKTQTDGRTRWRINPEVDWSLFQQHVQSPLLGWMHANRHIMPRSLAPPAPVTRLVGSLHACAYTDGASRGNPGAASCGGVIYLAKDKLGPAVPSTADPIYRFGKSLGIVTNNYAEYQGVIEVLEAAQQMGITHIKVYVDSQLVCRQIQGVYEVKDRKLQAQHARATALVSQMQTCVMMHVMREHNKEADAMCNRVLDMLEAQQDPVSLQPIPPDMLDTPDNGLSPEQRAAIETDNASLRALADTDTTEECMEDAPATLSQQQIDTCWEQLRDIITHSATSCVGTIDVMPHAKHWWGLSPGIRELHTHYVTRRSVMRKTVRDTTGRHTDAQKGTTQRQYMEARTAFRAAVREAKQKEWDQVAAACDEHTTKRKHKLVWSAFKRTKASTRVAAASFPDANGTPPLTAEQALTNMAAHLARVSSLPRSALFDAAHEDAVRTYMNTVPAAPTAPLPPCFSLVDVEKVCTEFRLNTALGSDNISPYFLRHGGKLLHRAVHQLLSICSWYGVVPAQFRHAHVFTLYKGDGEKADPNSYRPIAITSVLARVYERLHKSELIEAMTTQSIPSPHQFGFTRQRSCHDAIYRLLSLLVETHASDTTVTADNHFVPTVFVDISKAYDKVWIDGLLYKLHHDLGIRGNLFYMIRALLTSRTIQVVCDGKTSTLFDLTAGVPQGSILAPLLFLIYIHELTNIPGNNTSVLMSLFADDIALAPLRCGSLGVLALSSALFHLSDYARKWKITFSAKKTNVVYFRPGYVPPAGRGREPTPHVQGRLTLTGFDVDMAKAYTYLGVMLDQYLTYIPHMLALTKRVRGTAQVIARLVRRDHAPCIPVIQTLVKCVLVPQMTYGLAFIPPRLINNTVVHFHATGISHGNNTSKGNIASWLNSAMLQPLMRSLGVPFNTHHPSLRIETRLLSIQSLAALECARLAHRWVSNVLDATNPAAALFRTHATATTHPPAHPIVTIAAHIGRVPALCAITDTTDIIIDAAHNTVPPHHMRVTRRWLHRLAHIDRHKLKPMVWEQQYALFRAIPHEPSEGKNMYMHPLHYLQPRINKTPAQRQLPHYAHMDTAQAASLRARLRLGRARLRADQERIGWQVPSTSCRACQGDALTIESVHHVLQRCPCTAAVRLRARANRRLTKLYDRIGIAAGSSGRRPLSTNLVLRPWIDAPHPQDRWLRRVYTITGRYIIRLQQVWDY